MIEICWHGRGGQGGKTASILLAKIFSATGLYVQAFPEYGPERMGAPVVSYTRLADQPIHQHCQIERADYIIILDPTLIDMLDFNTGIARGGKIVLNLAEDYNVSELKSKLEDNIEVYAIDADNISEEELGRIFPNIAMMGAFNKIAGLIKSEDFFKMAEYEFQKKFRARKKIIAGNMRSLQRAADEVKII